MHLRNDTMNGPAKVARRTRSSKEAAMSKAKVRNPMREVNGGLAAPQPPHFGSSEMPRSGCVSFLMSNSPSRETLQHLRSSFKTPVSAPLFRRAAAPENRRAKPSRWLNSQNAATKCDPGASRKPGPRREARPKAPELLQRWNGRNRSLKREIVKKKCDFDDGSGGKTGACLASTPEKSVTLWFTSNAALPEALQGQETVANTPESVITPPIEASISPEVPFGASAVAAAPACFAAGHVLVGVHARRKCRPRGILIVGGGLAPEMTGDPARASTTPPIAGASIQWFSSPPRSVDTGIERNLGSSSRAHPARCAVSPTENGQFDKRLKSSADRGHWGYSPSASSARETPELPSHLLDLDLAPPATTPSGMNFQKTPTTRSSVSPFSVILERVAKASKFNPVMPQQNEGENVCGFTLESSPFSGETWINDNVNCMSSTDSISKRQLNFSPIENDEIAASLRNISLSPELATPVTSLSAPRFL